MPDLDPHQYNYNLDIRQYFSLIFFFNKLKTDYRYKYIPIKIR